MYFRFRFKHFRYRLFFVFACIFVSIFVFVNEYNVISLTTIFVFVFVNEINTEAYHFNGSLNELSNQWRISNTRIIYGVTRNNVTLTTGVNRFQLT
jgi:hypothetical protein